MSLRDVVFNYPVIDNNPYRLLKEEHRKTLPSEGAILEAQPHQQVVESQIPSGDRSISPTRVYNPL